MGKRIKSLAFTAAAVAGMVIPLVASTSASAAPQTPGYVDLTNDYNYLGTLYQIGQGVSIDNWIRVGAKDSISMISNNTDLYYCFYVDTNYHGTYLWLAPHVQGVNLASPFNDAISSLRPAPTQDPSNMHC